MNAIERKELAAEIKRQGFSIRIDRWPNHLTYYKKDGEPMPNLPADPWSMQQYLRRGYTLVPPSAIPTKLGDDDTSVSSPSGNGHVEPCEICGWNETDNTWRMSMHKRSHRPKARRRRTATNNSDSRGLVVPTGI